MEKEISSGAMLGVVLIALAAIIGLGFGIFAIAKQTANDGIADVQDNLEAASMSVYTDYDQKVVTGTQLNSAYNAFEGKNVAILVATAATKDQLAVEEGRVVDGNGVAVRYNQDQWENGAPLVPTDVTLFDSNGNETGQILQYVNYNALIGKLVDENQDGTYMYETGIEFDETCYKTDKGFYTIDGRVQFNNMTYNMSSSGMMEYIASNARFQSYLIRDKAGTIMGIAFEQIVMGG